MYSSFKPQISLVVQLRLSESWGSDEEIEERGRIAESIGIALEERGCGYLDGTDVGGGATNVFFCEIPEERWNEALEIAIDEIKRRGISEKVVIAKSVFIPMDPEPEFTDTIVWPERFKGDFDVFGWSGGR